MSILLGDNFQYQAAKPLDARLKYDTVAAMKAVGDSTMYEGCLAYCVATDKTYQWKSTNTVDADTGKWREFADLDVMPAADMSEVVDPLPSVSPSPIATSGDATVVSGIVSSGTIKWYRTGDVVQVVLTNCVFTSNSERNALICSGLPDPITTSCPCIQAIDNSSYLINVYSDNGEGCLSKGGATQITDKTVYSTFTYIAK